MNVRIGCESPWRWAYRSVRRPASEYPAKSDWGICLELIIRSIFPPDGVYKFHRNVPQPPSERRSQSWLLAGRISEKQGMRVVATKEGEYVCGRLLTEVWELTSEEWRVRKMESIE